MRVASSRFNNDVGVTFSLAPCFFWFSFPGQPPPEFLYLDGLTDLFLSKIRDAHCLPGRAYAPIVSTTVQQSWEWTKPEGAETPVPAPAIPWEPAGREGSGAQEEGAAALAVAAVALGESHRAVGGTAVSSGGQSTGPLVAIGSQVAGTAAAGERRAARGVAGAKPDAVRKLLRAIGGASEEDGAEEKTGVIPLWGPDEVSVALPCIVTHATLHALKPCALGVASQAHGGFGANDD